MNEGQAVNRGFFSRCIGVSAFISFNTSMVCKAQDDLREASESSNRRTLYEDRSSVVISSSARANGIKINWRNPYRIVI